MRTRRRTRILRLPATPGFASCLPDRNHRGIGGTLGEAGRAADRPSNRALEASASSSRACARSSRGGAFRTRTAHGGSARPHTRLGDPAADAHAGELLQHREASSLIRQARLMAPSRSDAPVPARSLRWSAAETGRRRARALRSRTGAGSSGRGGPGPISTETASRAGRTTHAVRRPPATTLGGEEPSGDSTSGRHDSHRAGPRDTRLDRQTNIPFRAIARRQNGPMSLRHPLRRGYG
jgi:hypothetical protein